MPISIRHTEREYHTLRLLATTAVSLLVLIAVVKLWPLPGDGEPDHQIYSTRGQDTIQMEEIVQTRQERRTPPPPAPLPPVVVPDDRIIEEELDFTDVFLLTPDPGDDAELQEGDDAGTPTALASVETGPKPVRIVEPDYPRSAKRNGVKAEVVVEVLIDARGQVQESKILERYLLGKNDDEKEPVDEIGFGIEESALAAAERWLYRPARKNGTPVTSYTTLTLSFGVQ